MAVDLGEAITRRINITDSTGAPIDADSTPTYAITLPDGTTGTPPVVTHGATGEYYVNFTTAQAGLHSDLWTATVVTLPLRFGPDTFLVRPGSPAPLLGLAEARSHLGITGVNAERDEQLREFVEAATELCEDHCYRVFRRRTVVETHDGGWPALVLRHTPVQSITGVTENGVALTSADWTLDAASGLLYRGTTTATRCWAPGVQNIVVTDVVGATAPSSRVRQAVRVTLKHLWDTQRGGSGLPRQAGSAGEYVTAGAPMPWSLPRRAEELLVADLAPGTFA